MIYNEEEMCLKEFIEWKGINGYIGPYATESARFLSPQ